MAFHFITASKDATVYLQQPNQNTGLDEILEISKIYYGNIKDVSRALIKFDLTNLSQSISTGDIELDTVILSLKQTESEEIPLQYSIFAHPISGSWEMGIGYRFDEITTAGVTWLYREGDSKIEWLENGLASGSTANPNDGRGGVWYTLVSGSQTFDYETADIHMNVKSVVSSWLSGSLENSGFILKYSSEFENDTNDYGILKFFSKETHTIYQPKLIISWDDQVINTGSLSPLTFDDGLIVRIKNFKKEYRRNVNTILRVVGRELYPLKTFDNPYPHLDVKYLPTTSYYQITDFETKEVIIPFSEHSKISCDANGNYIKLDLRNWEIDRVYKIEFKIDTGDDVIYFDDDYTFNIVDK